MMRPEKSNFGAPPRGLLLLAVSLGWLIGYVQGWERGRFYGQVEGARRMVRRSFAAPGGWR